MAEKERTQLMECNGNCNNCGNTDCEWYDDFLDDDEENEEELTKLYYDTRF